MILFIILYSTHAIAQTDYYYYKGEKIPLYINDNKVCVSIPKVYEETCERIIANVIVQDRIKDDIFDIFIILRSDFESLTSLDFWKEDAKSVIKTPCYYTTDGSEVFTTPYLNVQLKKEQDIDLLTSYAEQYRLSIVKQASPFMPLWYILALTQNCNKNSLECANELWESGEFAASVPDFCTSDILNDGIFSNVTDNNLKKSPIFDLHGRKLKSKPIRGVYILRGRKVLVKE